MENENKNTREILKEVGKRLFAEQGFHAVSVRQIVSEADCNIASINYHFGDKLGLFKAIMESHAESFMQRLSETDLYRKSPREQLLCLNDIIQDEKIKDPDMEKLFMRVLLSSPDSPESDVTEEIKKRYFQPLCERITYAGKNIKWQVQGQEMSSNGFLFLMISMNVYWALFSRYYLSFFDDYSSAGELRDEAFSIVRKFLEFLPDNLQ